MLILTFLAWGFLGFVLGMLGMIAWLDRGGRKLPDGRFDPHAAEAKAHQPPACGG